MIVSIAKEITPVSKEFDFTAKMPLVPSSMSEKTFFWQFQPIKTPSSFELGKYLNPKPQSQSRSETNTFRE